MSENQILVDVQFDHRGYVAIIGNSESLEALGQLLIAKSKLGKSLSATFVDDTNRPIHISMPEEHYKDF